MLPSGRGFLWIQETKTRTCNFFPKKIILSLVLNALLVFCCYSADSKWILAAESFSYSQKNMTSAFDTSISKALPSLILEQMVENLKRRPRSQELLARELYDLQKKRISLFLQLSGEVQKRDSVLLNDYSDKVLNSKIKAQDKKIKDISSQIHENLMEAEKVKQKYSSGIQKDFDREKNISEGRIIDSENDGNSFFRLFKGFIPGSKNEEPAAIEEVSFYGNSITNLFVPSEENKAFGYESYEFEKACVDAGINGLLTGKITVYGNFISVAVTVYQYPGARVICNAVEVGSMDELKAIASSLAMLLTPKISDSMPVSLKISVFPEEARKDLTVSIDDVIYRENTDSIILESGVHSIMFSSKGFDTVSTSYNFSGHRDFDVQVNMNVTSEGVCYLRLSKPFEGNLYTDGIFSGSISEESPYGKISINNRNILGHFVTKDGLPCDFIINQNILENGKHFVVKGKPFDKSDYIEKRRRWMYGSYSVLICSLLPAFYCYGNSHGTAVAYNNDRGISYDEAKKWQTASNVTMGISCACGAFFIYELIRYLKAANSVLPYEAKIDKNIVLDNNSIENNNFENNNEEEN